MPQQRDALALVYTRAAGLAARDGEMPPAMYLLMHPEAKLSDPEKQQLMRGMEASLR